jgi:asparagine synthase (glutamine-hydrolysing)
MRRLPAGALQLALDGFRRWPVSDEKIGFEYKVKRFLEGCRLPFDEAHVYWNGTFSQGEKQALVQAEFPGSLARVLGELRDCSATTDDLASYLWFDQKYFLPDDILTKVDRISMAHSVEVRPPFLDHRIVEFAASLPAAFKVHGSQQKILLKELMRDKLPLSILKRKKVGFDIPAHEWLRGPLRSLMVETLAAGVSEYAPFFRADTIETFVQQHLKRRANIGYHLWGLMILFLWMKKWKIQVKPSSAPKVRMRERAGSYTS